MAGLPLSLLWGSFAPPLLASLREREPSHDLHPSLLIPSGRKMIEITGKSKGQESREKFGAMPTSSLGLQPTYQGLTLGPMHDDQGFRRSTSTQKRANFPSSLHLPLRPFKTTNLEGYPVFLLRIKDMRCLLQVPFFLSSLPPNYLPGAFAFALVVLIGFKVALRFQYSVQLSKSILKFGPVFESAEICGRLLYIKNRLATVFVSRW